MRNAAFQTVKSAALALFFIVSAVQATAIDFRVEPLEIRLQNGKVLHLSVELATTTKEREIGLMNRDSMASDRGMLFDFGQSRRVYMWMKNTYLPLDMLFVSERGQIRHIHADALPLSESIVIELNGGQVAEWGIRPGDIATSATIATAASK